MAYPLPETPAFTKRRIAPLETRLAELAESNMAARVLSVVCAWCKRVVTSVPNATGITHTICPSCRDRAIAQVNDSPKDPAALQPTDNFGDASKR